MDLSILQFLAAPFAASLIMREVKPEAGRNPINRLTGQCGADTFDFVHLASPFESEIY